MNNNTWRNMTVPIVHSHEETPLANSSFGSSVIKGQQWQTCTDVLPECTWPSEVHTSLRIERTVERAGLSVSQRADLLGFFHTTVPEFPKKRRKHLESSSFLGGSTLLMSQENGQTALSHNSNSNNYFAGGHLWRQNTLNSEDLLSWWEQHTVCMQCVCHSHQPRAEHLDNRARERRAAQNHQTWSACVWRSFSWSLITTLQHNDAKTQQWILEWSAHAKSKHRSGLITGSLLTLIEGRLAGPPAPPSLFDE